MLMLNNGLKEKKEGLILGKRHKNKRKTGGSGTKKKSKYWLLGAERMAAKKC